MNLKALWTAGTLSFSVALAGAVFAQGPPPSQPGPPPRPSTPSMDGQTVTVTGCLVKASDLPGASAAAGTPASAAGDFALANVQMRSTSPGGATGAGTTPGSTATTPGATGATGGKGMNLKLTGSDSSKLTEHVNKQVEVTGRLSTSGATAGSATGTTGTPAPGTTGAAGARGAASGMGQLQVESIRPTGQSCTASGQ